MKHIKKRGIQNFKKTIIEFASSREELSDLEVEYVTLDLVMDPMCYNMRVGGDSGSSFYGMVTIRVIETGKCILVPKDRVKDLDKSKFEFLHKGRLSVIDKSTGKKVFIQSEDYHSNKDKYELIGTNKLIATGELSKGKVRVLDRLTNKMTMIRKELLDTEEGSIRYINSPAFLGKRHSDETKMVIGMKSSKRMKGSGNPMYGKSYKWIYHIESLERKRVLESDLKSYLDTGWSLGTKPKVHHPRKSRKNPNAFNLKGSIRITNGTQNKSIRPEDLDAYSNSGWKVGVTHKHNKQNHNPNSGCSGYKWMNNGNESKYVKSSDRDHYLSLGWTFGKVRH